MFQSTDLYIDLGTANTVIYARGKGFVLNEPSILAVKHRQNSSELFALGKQAKLMLGKAPERLSVLRPLREGVISDFDNTARMLHAYINRLRENMMWFRPKMIISLPCNVTQFEKRAVEEVGYALGARKVHLLDEPVAAAVGAGLPVLSNRGQMVVDIGGGTTEIAVMSMGGIVLSRAVRVGGDNIDASIISYLRNEYNFVIGEQTAERIKVSVGSAYAASPKRSVEVGGFNLIRGFPSRMIVDSNMIFTAIDCVVRDFIVAIRKTLESCPPEIAGDILQNGIVLAGGGALLTGLKERLHEEVGLPIIIADRPLLSVAMGGARALEDEKLFEAIERPA